MFNASFASAVVYEPFFCLFVKGQVSGAGLSQPAFQVLQRRDLFCQIGSIRSVTQCFTGKLAVLQQVA